MKPVRFAAIMLVAILLLAACAPAPAPTSVPVVVPPTVAPVVVPTTAPLPVSGNTTSKAGTLTLAKTSLGSVLADVDGKILYMFTKDTKDTSACYDTCATSWPPLLADKVEIKDGVDAKMIGSTKRTDGAMQVTYNGMPLYYFAKDLKAGDILGQNVGGSWFVVMADGKALKPATLTLAKTSLGAILADADGRALYMYTKDTKDPSVSNCYDACAQAWPVFYAAGKTDAKEGLNASLIGSTQRKDGAMQVTYNGWPLYYWRNDKNPGDTLGQAVGNIWWVMTADGNKITSAASPAVKIVLGAGRDGDQNGTATLTEKGNQTVVTLAIQPGAAGAIQPAHIHVGQCPAPDAVKYPLTNVVDGKSSTTLDVKLSDLLKGGMAINVHLSAQDIGKYVACGNVPEGVILTMDKGRDLDQAGSAVLVSQGAKTEVGLFIKPAPGLTQPAHIHVGVCPVPGDVKYPLTNVVDGQSKTVVDAALGDLLKGGFAVNAHLSAQDIGKYVACGNLKAVTAP